VIQLHITTDSLFGAPHSVSCQLCELLSVTLGVQVGLVSPHCCHGHPKLTGALQDISGAELELVRSCHLPLHLFSMSFLQSPLSCFQALV
jgi:hypothetical protein